MKEYEYRTDKILSYAWLVVAIAAIFGAIFKGAWHQLLIAYISVVMFLIMHPKKWVHIPDEIYNNLNLKICSIVSTIEDHYKHTSVEEEVDGICVSLEIELNAKSSKNKFRDDAWGSLSVFTEVNFDCEIKILAVEVTDMGEQIFNSDFDDSRIETSYDVTEWK